MSVVKIIEISAASPKSFDNAIQIGIDKAGLTLNNIRGAWVGEQKVVVKEGKIAEYRVDLKVSFVLDD